MSFGKLTHDNSCCPRTVFRMQDRKGRGPYRDDSRPFPAGRESTQPEPYADLTPDEMDVLRKGKVRFAFRRPGDAARWFTKPQLKHLHEHGFKVVPVKASRVWLSWSKRQVLYMPAGKRPAKCRRVKCKRGA